MTFDICLLAAAVGGIHQHHVHLILPGIVQHVMRQGIVMINAGYIEPMQQQIGYAEHIGELLFFDAVDGMAVSLFGIGGGDLLFQLFQPADDKATGAAGEVCHHFADLRPDHLRHKVGDGAGRIKFAGRTGALQLFEDGFIDLAKRMAFLIVAKVQLVNDVEHLPKQYAILHILVGIGKRGLHNGLADGRGSIHTNSRNLDFAVGILDISAFEHRKQPVVDKIQQLVAGHGLAGLIVMRPVLPAACLWDDGLIVVIFPCPILLFCIIDL